MLSKCIVCDKVIDIDVIKDRICCEGCKKIKEMEEFKFSSADKAIEKCFICGDMANYIRTIGALRIPVCSNSICRKSAEREYFRIKMQRRRHKDSEGYKCEVPGCGFDITVDKHHSLDRKVTYFLCPNHHAMISRGYKSLEELGVVLRSA